LLVRESSAGQKGAFGFEELTEVSGRFRGSGAIPQEAGLEVDARLVLILVDTGQTGLTRKRREVIQPVVGTITGVEFFPRENADAGEGDKIQLTFLRSGSRVWTQATIDSFIFEIIVRKPAVTRGVLLRVNVLSVQRYADW